MVLLAFVQYPLFGWYTGRCILKEYYVRLGLVWSALQVIPMLAGLLN